MVSLEGLAWGGVGTTGPKSNEVGRPRFWQHSASQASDVVQHRCSRSCLTRSSEIWRSTGSACGPHPLGIANKSGSAASMGACGTDVRPNPSCVQSWFWTTSHRTSGFFAGPPVDPGTLERGTGCHPGAGCQILGCCSGQYGGGTHDLLSFRPAASWPQGGALAIWVECQNPGGGCAA